MGKYLTGSSQTGAKIMANWNLFNFSLSNSEKLDNGSVLYSFSWSFGTQNGYASIKVQNSLISNSSLLDTNDNSTHAFARPLGLYNDKSLEQVFSAMMSSINVPTAGVYSEPF